jgi:hypothetical protein
MVKRILTWLLTVIMMFSTLGTSSILAAEPDDLEEPAVILSIPNPHEGSNWRPNAVKSLDAELSGANIVTLDWKEVNPVKPSSVLMYLVSYKKDNAEEFTSYQYISKSFAEIEGLIPDSTYVFMVQTVELYNMKYYFSDETISDVINTGTASTAKRPKAVTDLKAELIEGNQTEVKLTWSAMEPVIEGDEILYQVLYKKTSEDSYTAAQTVSDTYAVLDNLLPETDYLFVVKTVEKGADNVFYYSFNSNAAEVTTGIDTGNKKVSNPTKLVGAMTDYGFILMSEFIANASGYEFYVSNSENGTYELFGQSDTHFYIEQDLKKGTYYFKVLAYNDISISDLSPAFKFVYDGSISTPTETPTPTATNTPTSTVTPEPTETNTPTPTATNTPAPTATNTPTPTATNTPTATGTITPTPTETGTPTPSPTDTPSPVPTLPGDIDIDAAESTNRKIYARQGSTVFLEIVGNNGNDVIWSSVPKPGVIFTSNNQKASVKIGLTVDVGTRIQVTAKLKLSPNVMDVILITVIPKEGGIIDGADGKRYVDYGDNTFEQILDSGFLGEMISGGMDRTPGSSDDRSDVIIATDDTKYLGPNPDGSYQKKGPDGLLGTEDDIFVWKKDPNKPIAPDNETEINPGITSTVTPTATNTPTPIINNIDITSDQYENGELIFGKQGTTVTLKVDVDSSVGIYWNHSSEAGFIFNQDPAVSGTATVDIDINAAVGSRYRVIAMLKENHNVSRDKIIVVIPADTKIVTGADGKIYLDFADNTFKEINSNGTIDNKWICGGIDKVIGSADDRFDVIVTDDGTKYLGPNHDESYQKVGPDKLLGTEDDEFVWKKDSTKEIGPDNEVTTPPTKDIRNILITPGSTAIAKGSNQTFSAIVYFSNDTEDSKGVKWELSGAASTETSLISEDSSKTQLKVSVNETSEVLSIRAISLTNNEVAATASVFIIGNGSGGSISTIDDSSIGEVITLDGKSWIVAQKVLNGSNKYSLLVSNTLVAQTDFGGTEYEGSTLQKFMTEYFVASGVTVKANAVIPKLNLNSGLADVSMPTTRLALDGTIQTKDVMFALSRGEALSIPMQSWGVNSGNGWWLRNALSDGSHLVARGMSPTSGKIDVVTNGKNYVRPAVWVKY